MSEIEKLYKLAGIEPDINYICDIEPCKQSLLYDGCEECSRLYDVIEGYPEFTAEKQIELIKWLIKNEMLYRLEGEYPYFENFEECIAYIINYVWQDLTLEGKQQVKRILE